jgi:hypothetical protein
MCALKAERLHPLVGRVGIWSPLLYIWGLKTRDARAVLKGRKRGVLAMEKAVRNCGRLSILGVSIFGGSGDTTDAEIRGKDLMEE